ncbi:hypothetical protein [Streptacidiphilus sp. EB103A]
MNEPSGQPSPERTPCSATRRFAMRLTFAQSSCVDRAWGFIASQSEE